MLTGDQLNTARSIAMKLGIAESGRLEARHAHDLATVVAPISDNWPERFRSLPVSRQKTNCG
jgi:magnesium-transporting ATPase (P-type)